jgi:hypothetical protein
MRTIRKSPRPAEIAPEQRRDEIVAILAAGLARLIGGSEAAASVSAETAASISGIALASMPGEKLSESGEIGLELPRRSSPDGQCG